MQNFASTPEERCRQEVNIALNELDEHLKTIRRELVENYHLPAGRPALHFIARMEGAVTHAAELVEGAEYHWKVA